MADFVEVARLDQVPPGTSRLVSIAGKDVALFNVDGNVYAISDACLHQGQSLSAGRLDDRVVTCRAHGWRYDVTDGSLTTVPERRLASYPVQVVDGKILVRSPEPSTQSG